MEDVIQARFLIQRLTSTSMQQQGQQGPLSNPSTTTSSQQSTSPWTQTRFNPPLPLGPPQYTNPSSWTSGQPPFDPSQPAYPLPWSFSYYPPPPYAYPTYHHYLPPPPMHPPISAPGQQTPVATTIPNSHPPPPPNPVYYGPLPPPSAVWNGYPVHGPNRHTSRPNIAPQHTSATRTPTTSNPPPNALLVPPSNASHIGPGANTTTATVHGHRTRSRGRRHAPKRTDNQALEDINEVNEEEAATPRQRTSGLQNRLESSWRSLRLTAMINERTTEHDGDFDREQSREEFERKFPLNIACKMESRIFLLEDNDKNAGGTSDLPQQREDIAITPSNVPGLVQKIRDPADVNALLSKIKDAIEREENVANSVLADIPGPSNRQRMHETDSIKSIIRKSALEFFETSLGDDDDVLTFANHQLFEVDSTAFEQRHPELGSRIEKSQALLACAMLVGTLVNMGIIFPIDLQEFIEKSLVPSVRFSCRLRLIYYLIWLSGDRLCSEKSILWLVTLVLKLCNAIDPGSGGDDDAQGNSAPAERAHFMKLIQNLVKFYFDRTIELVGYSDASDGS
ncbi:hypothetical protein SCHPADRAFT_943126 [Schizopora paradoxa]|uniref:Uncharacterized protein n=1 Tax=Schizopora paradoxa TaxID=27342 RepID=A0A0H2RE78_9AGAM|nr:hypothetical protein SCHPADRAFT_943126 [Schizopora paradoxa]